MVREEAERRHHWSPAWRIPLCPAGMSSFGSPAMFGGGCSHLVVPLDRKWDVTSGSPLAGSGAPMLSAANFTKAGSLVPGSGSGDQVPVGLPSSFVLTGRHPTLPVPQSGVVLSQRFTANEVHSKRKKRSPVVVVNIPDPAQMPSPPASPKQIESPSSGGLNISKIRSTMNRVNAGAAF